MRVHFRDRRRAAANSALAIEIADRAAQATASPGSARSAPPRLCSRAASSSDSSCSATRLTGPIRSRSAWRLPQRGRILDRADDLLRVEFELPGQQRRRALEPFRPEIRASSSRRASSFSARAAAPARLRGQLTRPSLAGLRRSPNSFRGPRSARASSRSAPARPCRAARARPALLDLRHQSGRLKAAVTARSSEPPRAATPFR